MLPEHSIEAPSQADEKAFVTDVGAMAGVLACGRIHDVALPRNFARQFSGSKIPGQSIASLNMSH
jgi:hypothetical protein